jgi:hypothetical protein
MLLKLLNTSEQLTETIISKTLKDSNYRVYAQLLISKVINRNSDILEKVDKEFFWQASFDFVIYNSNSLPVLVIEFDGPCHEQYEKQKQSEIKKNRLCQFVGLPLIRIGDTYIEEHDKISLLEYILNRFLLWDNEGKELTNQMYEILANSTEEELKVLTKGGFIDPIIDPTFVFDSKYPFPATIEIAKRLWNDYRIVSIFLPRQFGPTQRELFGKRRRTIKIN